MDDEAPAGTQARVTAMVLDPGHPHAALLFAHAHALLADEVHVFSRGGEGVAAFKAMLVHFNERELAPTRWRVIVHPDGEPLETLLTLRPGNFAVVAGRHDRTLRQVAALHRGGVPVLANQPWLVDEATLPKLRQVCSAAPLAMEMNPARFDALTMLRQRIVRSDSLFGDLESRDSEGPAIDIGALYHLRRSVGEHVVRRPAWQFDEQVSGDGVGGGTPHLVDKVQAIIGVERVLRFDSDAAIRRVRRWRTEVPLETFREVACEQEFPRSSSADVSADVLSLSCNARIDFELLGVTARTRVEWRVREPDDGGTVRHEIVRGRRADLVLRQNKSSGFEPQLLYRPRHARELPQMLDEALAAWQTEFPGAKAEATPAGIEVSAGQRAGEGLEHGLARVMSDFVERLASGQWPAERLSAVRLRYRLLLAAADMAEDGVRDETTIE